MHNQNSDIYLEETDLDENDRYSQFNTVTKLAIEVVATAAINLFGWITYNDLGLVKRESDAYQDYIDNCQIFIERAEAAGTSAPAKEQLFKAISWLEVNYPTSSFEYKDLKADFYYLEQNSSPLIPEVIKHSIKNNHHLIDEFEHAKRTASNFKLSLTVSLPITTFAVTLCVLYLFFPNLFYSILWSIRSYEH